VEWITVTAPTVSEAKEQLLDKLGVPDGEAEFVVEDEGESKFFGLRRTQARVRARVRPRGREERRDRKRTRPDRKRRKAEGGSKVDKPRQSPAPEKGAEGSAPATKGKKTKARAPRDDRATPGRSPAQRGSAPAEPAAAGPSTPKKQREEVPMDEVSARLQAFLDGLTDAFGVDTTTTITETDDHLTAQIAGQHGVLVGPKARTLDAIQELAKIAALKGGSSSARVRVDVGEYRERRAAALVKFAEQAADKVVTEQTEVVLEPMSSADRKIVHDALAGQDGIQTRSVGTDPRRRVVIAPADR
jgi:spoIIIJ-associated protein